ncbi:hypothetical protein B0H14DRAFT_3505935 [Mycena olivaceomarginata]|nr:hypothetical protein B0H14DRAFT_3505935 [Mycena olivaceomarginata]
MSYGVLEKYMGLAPTQPAPSSLVKSEGASKSASTSTSKPRGTIHVKKEGAASGKTPATPTALSHPTPKATYHSAPSSVAASPTPDAKHLFNDECLPDSSSKTSHQHPQVELHTQSRPPSVETEQLEQKSSKAAKVHAAALPPAGERPMRDVDPATHLEVVPHDAVAELTNGSLSNCEHTMLITAHNFDCLCTKVVVLFNHPSSVLPLLHLEQMFEDPEDIQMLHVLSGRATEASSRKALEASYRHERPVTTSGPDSNRLTYYARHHCDAFVRHSTMSALCGSEHLSPKSSPTPLSMVPKQKPATSSVQRTSHVHFEQPPITTMSVASNSPPPSPDGLPSGNLVAPHTPRATGDAQPMEGVIGGEGSHAVSV